jgi:hypothetical protein
VTDVTQLNIHSGTKATAIDFTDMEFSRHPDARTERMDQIATMLCDAYPPLREGLPPIIAERLEQLERAEFRSNQHGATGRE